MLNFERWTRVYANVYGVNILNPECKRRMIAVSSHLKCTKKKRFKRNPKYT